ncbi:MAG: DedA family protein [Bacteroidales bacterium]|nr:DedA family protein [Bacteroidales bacterium]
MILENLGYFGLAVGAFLASTVVPFSADALLVGCLAVGMNTFLCLLIATFFNWLGGMTSYYIGLLGNMERIEKWFHINKERLENQRTHILKWKELLAFVTWLPLVGDVFAVALGFYKIAWKKCALWMFIGRSIRFVVWVVVWKMFGIDLL